MRLGKLYKSIAQGSRILQTTGNKMKKVHVCLLLYYCCFINANVIYVDEECSNEVPTPCYSLSQFNTQSGPVITDDLVIYLTTSTNHTLNTIATIIAKRNITLSGLNGQVAVIHCSGEGGVVQRGFYISHSIDFKLVNLSIHNCRNNMTILQSQQVSLSNIVLHNFALNAINVFNFNISLSNFINSTVLLVYNNDTVTGNSVSNSTLYISHVTVSDHGLGTLLGVVLNFGMEYSLDILIEHVIVREEFEGGNTPYLFFVQTTYSLYYLHIRNVSVLNHRKAGLVIIVLPDYQYNNVMIPNTNLILIEDSNFEDNGYGLALFISPNSAYNSQSIITIRSCLVRGNRLAGMAANYETSFCPSCSLSTTISVHINDTVLYGNQRNLLIGNTNTVTLRNITIVGSIFTGLTLINANVRIEGNLTVRDNSGTDGGGIAFYDNSQLLPSPSTTIILINNSATHKGGAIFQGNLQIYTLDGQVNVSPLGRSSNATFLFHNNTAAVVGGDLYNAQLTCDLYKCASDSGIIDQSSDPVELCYCNINTGHCIGTDVIPQQFIYPGQSVKYALRLAGFNNASSRTSATDGSVNVILNSRLISISSINANCTSRSTVINTNITNTTIRNTIRLDLITSTLAAKLAFDSELSFKFAVSPCPIGFTLTSTGVCNCSHGIERQNVSCDIERLEISHTGRLWLGTYYSTGSSIATNVSIDSNECYVSERCFLYCTSSPVTFPLNETDRQCIDNRGQRLCGACKDGYSQLLGTDRCGECSTSYNLFLIIVFALLGIGLVVLLIALNLTVAVGTINGVLFFANIVKVYEPIFSRQGAVPFLSQVISWINLDFGVEVCFYHGMDRYAKEWLQYVFPFYLWTIIIVIIYLCRISSRISRLVGSNAVPVLATLLLLSYTKLSRSVVINLHKRDMMVTCSNGERRPVTVWYDDPSIEYGKGKHIPLLIFTVLFFLFFIIPFVLFVTVNPFIEKYLSKYKVFHFWFRIKPVVDAFSGPMKDRYRFWPGLLMIARFFVLLSLTLADVVLEIRYRLLGILLGVLAVLFTMAYSFGGVYRKHAHDIIEAWFLFLLSVTVGLAVAISEEHIAYIWYSICLAIFTCSFAGIIVYHIYMQVSTTKWYRSLKKKLSKRRHKYDIEENMETPLPNPNEITTDEIDVHQKTGPHSYTSTEIMLKELERNKSVTDLFDT